MHAEIYTFNPGCYFECGIEIFSSYWPSYLIKLLPQIEDWRKLIRPDIPVKFAASSYRPAQNPKLWNYL